MLNSPNNSGLVQGLEEAPDDGLMYARRSKVWATVQNPSTNIIINGDLTVNQRNVDIASAAVGQFGQDRWKKSTASTMKQTVEDLLFDAGEVYTLSYFVNGGFVEQQVTMPNSGHYTTPDIPITARKIQLEKGTVRNEFERRDPITELRMCSRYYMFSPSSIEGKVYFRSDEQNSRRRTYQMDFPEPLHHSPNAPSPNGGIEGSFTPGAGFGTFYNASAGTHHLTVKGETTGAGNYNISAIRLSAELTTT